MAIQQGRAVVLDPRCVSERITTTTGFEVFKQRGGLRTRQQCAKCGGCVVTFAGDIGGVTQMDNAAAQFCAPGQYETRGSDAPPAEATAQAPAETSPWPAPLPVTDTLADAPAIPHDVRDSQIL